MMTKIKFAMVFALGVVYASCAWAIYVFFGSGYYVLIPFGIFLIISAFISWGVIRFFTDNWRKK